MTDPHTSKPRIFHKTPYGKVILGDALDVLVPIA